MGRMFRRRLSLISRVAVAITFVLTNNYALGAALSWANAGGGSASIAANWNPAQVPTAADDLTFNLAGNYGVTFNASTTASRTQTFRQGTVTLTMSSPHTTSTGITIGSLGGDNATATFTTGTWNSGGPITIGNATGATGTLNVNDDDADLLMTGTTSDMIVGSNGPGTLNVTGGGLVQVADQLVAGSNASSTSNVTISGATNILPVVRSTLIVNGTGTTAVTSSKLGQGGDATVNISNGALADFAGDVVVANGSASTSTVTIGGTGGLVPQNATLDVAGSLLLGRNHSAGVLAGIATLNVNAGGRLIVGDTLFVAGDPDGGTATLNTAVDSAITTRSLEIGAGSTLGLSGGAINIDGGTLVNATGAALDINGGPGDPTVTLINGATATLNPVAGVALRVGGGSGANFADFDVRSGSDLIVGGQVQLGVGSDDNGGMIINGAGSTMTLGAGSELIVGNGGFGRFEAELGGAVVGSRMSVARNAGSTGLALIENAGTTAQFTDVYVGGGSAAAGGSGTLSVNNNAVLTVTNAGTSMRVWPAGLLDVSSGVLNANGTIIGDGRIQLQGVGQINAAALHINDELTAHPNIVGGPAVVNASVRVSAGAELRLVNGDLTIGNPTDVNGFDAQDGSLVDVGAHTLTVHDQNRARFDEVTINGGHIIAPNGVEIVTPGQNGRLDGTGTITGQVFMESGGSVITATGTNGITINGQFRNNSGNIDGTKYTFNNNPNLAESGWTGAGAINARVVFNSGTTVRALANMTMGLNVPDGVTFNLGSELHADTRTITLIDSNGVGLGSVTDVNGGHIICAQPLTVNNGRRLSGRGGSIDAPTVTVLGRLSPGELVGEPLGETGELTINGNLVMGANTQTDIEIQGIIGPIEYDRVAVNGTATLDGALNVSFLNGFVPPLNTALTVMTYNAKTGDFSSINLPPSPTCVRVAVGDTAVIVTRGLLGDIDQDGDVDINDLTILLSNFGCRGGVEFPCPIDLDLDGDTSINDLTILLSDFGRQCN